jgi:putative ABC transport system substrate-binding protein
MRRLACLLAATAMLAAGASLHAQTSGKLWRLAVLSPIDFELMGGVVLTELARQGFAEPRNLVLDVRVGPAEQLPELARSMVAAEPDAIVAVSDWAVQAARQATRTIPIVMSPMGQDPISVGVVSSWARPGGNVTGVVLLVPEMDGKRVGLLHEAVPAAKRVAVLATHETPNDEIRAAAAAAGLELIEFSVSGREEYQSSFQKMRSAGAQALGCLIGYGPHLPELYRRVVDYVVRIFRGAAPGELPIEGPTRIELALNANTARALGLVLPAALVARADAVIE